jgi:acyl carrier protein
VTTAIRDLVAHREDVLARVRLLLIEKLRVRRAPEEIDPDTPLFGTGLGLDSIDSVELLVCLDTDFGLRIPNDTSGRAALRTVNGVVDLVLAHERAAHGPA